MKDAAGKIDRGFHKIHHQIHQIAARSARTMPLTALYLTLRRNA
jgi:hypothetical protein